MQRSPRPIKTLNLSDSVHLQLNPHPVAVSAAVLRTPLRLSKAALALVLAFLPLLAAVESAHAQTYQVLYSFKGMPDGSWPQANPILDSDGNLYGTTYQGGTSFYGSAYKLDVTGKETVLYSFLGGYGQNPTAGLIRDAKGNLYGTTFWGGAYDEGAVFKLTQNGHEVVLHSFTGSEGLWPAASLIMEQTGNLYGTTLEYGNCCGEVFKLDSSGRLAILHKFCSRQNCSDGADPDTALIWDKKGNLYGVASAGGSESGCCGLVFRLNANSKETVLYRFKGGPGGKTPSGGLARDTAGNLYGTTVIGGTTCSQSSYGCGVVFKVDTVGRETVLHRFTGTGGDGANPYGGLVLDSGGNLYGTTSVGGDLSCGYQGSGCGIVFKLDPTGKETVLHSFRGGADGQFPEGGGSLAMDAAGNLYGTTAGGGTYTAGTVFKLTP
jgi:uncharacterized repeat protein (TIGR03803 family)